MTENVHIGAGADALSRYVEAAKAARDWRTANVAFLECEPYSGVFRVPSRKTAGVFYAVDLEKMTCTCKGHHYHGHCAHADDLLTFLPELERGSLALYGFARLFGGHAQLRELYLSLCVAARQRERYALEVDPFERLRQEGG